MFTTVHTVNSKCECARVFVIKTLTNVDNQMEIDCDVDGLVGGRIPSGSTVPEEEGIICGCSTIKEMWGEVATATGMIVDLFFSNQKRVAWIDDEECRIAWAFLETTVVSS